MPIDLAVLARVAAAAADGVGIRAGAVEVGVVKAIRLVAGGRRVGQVNGRHPALRVPLEVDAGGFDFVIVAGVARDDVDVARIVELRRRGEVAGLKHRVGNAVGVGALQGYAVTRGVGLKLGAEVIRLNAELVVGLKLQGAQVGVALLQAANLKELNSLGHVHRLLNCRIDVARLLGRVTVILHGGIGLGQFRVAQRQTQRSLQEGFLVRQVDPIPFLIAAVHALGAIIVGVAVAGMHLALLAHIQRIDDVEIDAARHAAFNERGLRRLVNGDAVDEFGRILVEFYGAPKVRRHLLPALHGGEHELIAQPANLDVRRLPARPSGGEPGNPGEAVGDGEVGQAADVFRRDHLHDGVRIALAAD